MSICSSCQAVNPDSYQFCQSCGTKILVDNSSMNILGEEALKPSSTPTMPLNLENILEEIQIQVEELASSQLEGNSAQSPQRSLEEITPSSSAVELAKDLANTNPELPTVIHPRIVSTMQLLDLVYAGKTDVGRQRDRNEDDFVTILQTRCINGKSQTSDRSYRGLFVLCDGMGGHDGGSEASAIAVNSITEQFQPFWSATLPGAKKLNEVISKANQEIFERNESEQRQDLSRMGTTLVMLAVHDLEVAIAHVGDSRIYKVTNSTNSQNSPTENSDNSLESAHPKLEQITRDHEVLNQLLDLGMDFESASTRPNAHQLTQALGPNSGDRLEPAIQFFALTEPALFLLCSDGLCDNDAIEQNWQTHLLPILNQEIDIETGLDNLIELGNNVNGHDNLTAILVLCNLVA